MVIAMKPYILTCLALALLLTLMPLVVRCQVSWQEIGSDQNFNSIMSLSSSRNGKVFLGSSTKGTLMSPDNGITWSKRILGDGDHDNGTSSAIFVNPATNDVYVGQSNGFVYLSLNFGQTFDVLYSFLSFDPAPVSIADDADGNTYIAHKSGEIEIYRPDHTCLKSIMETSFSSLVQSIDVDSQGSIFVSTVGNGIFRTTDMGDNWTNANSGLTSLDVRKVAVAPNGDIFAGLSGSGGIYKSTDCGSSWQISCDNSNKPVVTDIFVWNRNTIFVATTDNIFQSDNLGKTWKSIKSNLTNIHPQKITVDSQNYLYLGTSDGKLYRSILPLYVDKTYLAMDVSPYLPVTVAPGKSVTYSIQVKDYEQKPIGNVNIKVLDEVNGTPFDVATDNTGKAAFSLNVPSGIGSGEYTLHFSAFRQGYAYSDTLARKVHVQKEDSWRKVTSFDYDRRIISLLTDGSDKIYCGTSGEWLIASTDDGSSWFYACNGLSFTNSIYKIIKNNLGYIYIATDNDGIVKSEDHGLSWIKKDYSLSNTVNVLLCDDGTLFACDKNGATYRSDNDGVNFNKLTNYPSAIKSVADIISIDSHLFVAAYADGLFCSSDKGDSWQKVTNGIEGYSISSIAAGNKGEIFVGTANHGVYSSPVNALNFAQRNKGIENFNITGLLACKDILFARAFGKGVWYSTDSGKNWIEFNDGLEGLSFKDVFSFDACNDGYIYAGTFDKNLYKRPLPSITSVEVNPFTESFSFILYPNPTSGRTAIEYDLPFESLVTIAIYDLKGNYIKMLYTGYQPLGHYNSAWDGKDNSGKDVPPGTYVVDILCHNISGSQMLQVIR
jgi:photosystem II stability/assembly factor-like uncharacterized protein